MKPIGYFICCVCLVAFVGTVGMAIDKGRARMATQPIVDELETRLVVSMRLELSRERAYRLFPDSLNPRSDLCTRMKVIYDGWVAVGDERLESTDWPCELAREASR